MIALLLESLWCLLTLGMMKGLSASVPISSVIWRLQWGCYRCLYPVVTNHYLHLKRGRNPERPSWQRLDSKLCGGIRLTSGSPFNQRCECKANSLNSPLPSTFLSLTPRGCKALAFLSLVLLERRPAEQLQQQVTDQRAPSSLVHKSRKHCLLCLARKWSTAVTFVIFKFKRIKATRAIVHSLLMPSTLSICLVLICGF